MASHEAVNPVRSRAYHVLTRKRNEVLSAINTEDELELIIWKFEECKDLWETVQLKHEYISMLYQNDEELLETEENWLTKIQELLGIGKNETKLLKLTKS